MTIDDLISKLQNIYVRYEKLISYACDLEDEICNLNGEIQRLNNVLNELENWLEERSGNISFAYKHTLSKLKELKESDK